MKKLIVLMLLIICVTVVKASVLEDLQKERESLIKQSREIEMALLRAKNSQLVIEVKISRLDLNIYKEENKSKKEKKKSKKTKK